VSTTRPKVIEIGYVEDLRLHALAQRFWKTIDPFVGVVRHYIETGLTTADNDHECLKSYSGNKCKRKREAIKLWRLFQSISLRGFIPDEEDMITCRLTKDGILARFNGSHRAAILKALNRPVPAKIIQFETDQWHQQASN